MTNVSPGGVCSQDRQGLSAALEWVRGLPGLKANARLHALELRGLLEERGEDSVYLTDEHAAARLGTCERTVKNLSVALSSCFDIQRDPYRAAAIYRLRAIGKTFQRSENFSSAPVSPRPPSPSPVDISITGKGREREARSRSRIRTRIDLNFSPPITPELLSELTKQRGWNVTEADVRADLRRFIQHHDARDTELVNWFPEFRKWLDRIQPPPTLWPAAQPTTDRRFYGSDSVRGRPTKDDERLAAAYRLRAQLAGDDAKVLSNRPG